MFKSSFVNVQNMMFSASLSQKTQRYEAFAPNTVRDLPGARRKKKIVGRGPGCKKG